MRSLPDSLRMFLCLCAVFPVVDAARASEKISYRHRIAPLLQTHCLGCHNRIDAEKGLSLQAADDIEHGSEDGRILNRDAANESRLWKVLVSNGDDHMPPADQPQLAPHDIKTIQTWLAEGAAFDSRAAFMAELPDVKVSADTIRDPILAMAISRNASRIAIGRYKAIEIRSMDNDELTSRIAVEDGKVNDVQFSTDGQQVLLATGVTGLSGRAVVIDLAQQKIVNELAGHNDVVYAAVWSPDQSLIATAGYDRRILLHNAESGELFREMNGHNGAIFDLQFSPDGTLLASASADGTIKVWHVATRERLDTLSQPQAEQYSVRFSPDGNSIYASGADNRIRKWNLLSRTSQIINPLLISRFAHEGVITTLEISPDGRYLATTEDQGILKLWDALRIRELTALDFGSDRATSFVFAPDSNTLILGTTKGLVRRVPVPVIPTPDIEPAESLSMNPPANPHSPVIAAQPIAVAESEPNNLTAPQAIPIPSEVSGVIHTEADGPDQDVFRFHADKGRRLMVEVKASRDQSPLDSFVEILHEDGSSVLQVKLQAVRDSYFTFRGKDSDASGDFRMFNWQEMELNQYLYSDGEVVKLWLYPRGPDSGFIVYPGVGNRFTYFGTTPTAHALQAPAFIVEAHRPDEVLTPSGLPEFPIYFENDDDPMRQWGRDSRLMFDPPSDGEYLLRIRDARDFEGNDFKYQLMLRAPQPDFSVEIGGNEVTMFPEVGHELSFKATRLDGYDGPVEISAENLPAGFSFSGPIEIQSEQLQAFGTLITEEDAVEPTEDSVKQIRFVAKAKIADQDVMHEVGGIKSLKLGKASKVIVRILSAEQQAEGSNEQTPELTVWAGETLRAFIKVERLDHDGLVEFGKEDAGRNMPHGVFVDNIGLNGLMLLSGQTEREFFITTASWVPETDRLFHLKSGVDGITSLPVMLHVRHRELTPTDAPALRPLLPD
jgi:WD40 repeat protein